MVRTAEAYRIDSAKKGTGAEFAPPGWVGAENSGACPPNYSQERVMGFEPTTTTLAT
jgi:hypothetical protein